MGYYRNQVIRDASININVTKISLHKPYVNILSLIRPSDPF